MAMRTANPALNSDTFTDAAAVGGRAIGSQFGDATMTLNGTVGKSFILLFLLLAAAMWTWKLYFTTHSTAVIGPWMGGGLIGGAITAFVTIFKKEWSPVTAPLYAILEGFAIGGLSSYFENSFPGIVIQSAALTIATLCALLTAYATRVVRPSENFKLGVFAATGGIALVYLATFVLGLFHINMPFIHDSGPIGIGISLFITVVAALNLVLDFDFIETGANARAPKYMEWYGAFGLMVTLVWLYLEILRLMSKLRSRD